jgi:hypothetical protein
MAGELAIAGEAMAEVPMLPFQGRHQRCNKGKDGDMLRTSMEKMATYIGTKFGDEAAQEWISSKRIISHEPAYSQAILDRHVARFRATKDRI